MSDADMDKRVPVDLGVFGHLIENAENFRCVVKDRAHRYLYVNRGWLVSVGYRDSSEVLGKTAMDLFPAWRAERYMAEEREILEKGRCFDYEETAVLPGGGNARWRSLKFPWVEGGRIVGLAGIGMLLEHKALQERRADVRPDLLEWMEQHACDALSIEEIAKQNNMSRRTLERLFHEQAGESPIRYRLRCRIERAKALLRGTEEPLIRIAAECGFSDQSHFSRVFHKETGFSPSEWRTKESE
jgi:AraC-like DNA-binding protein